MDWGLHFPSHIHSWKWVSYGEAKGFSYYMPYDSIGSDVYEILALCAVNTKTIKLGPGVTSPGSRIAPVTARAMATLNELAPGRCILGIAIGNTARRAWGMPPAKIDEVKEFAETCRRMFKGEEAPYVEGPDRYMKEERHRYVRFLSPDWWFINIKNDIPIFLAGSGPRMLELAGGIGDGVILLGAIGESFVDYCMEHIKIGAKKAGRDPKSLYTTVLTAFHSSCPPRLSWGIVKGLVFWVIRPSMGSGRTAIRKHRTLNGRLLYLRCRGRFQTCPYLLIQEARRNSSKNSAQSH
jgi:5,10-methylenetetrahydromethanopterin reductase